MDFDRCIGLNPKFLHSYFYKAYCLELIKKTEKALETLETVNI